MKLLDKKDGYKWTQAAADVDIKDRIIVSMMYLADSAKESDWKQITDAEAEILEEQQKNAYEAERSQIEAKGYTLTHQ